MFLNFNCLLITVPVIAINTQYLSYLLSFFKALKLAANEFEQITCSVTFIVIHFTKKYLKNI